MCLCFKHARLLDSFFFLSFCFAFSRFCVSGVYAYACTYTHDMHTHTTGLCMHVVCMHMSLPKNPNPFLHVFLLFYSNVLVVV